MTITGTDYGTQSNPLFDEAYIAYQQMSAARSILESHWDEIAALLWPEMRSTFSPGQTMRSPYDKRTDKQLDSSPQIALQNFGAIMDSLLTPRNQKWHRLTTNNKDLNKIRRVKLYYEDVTNALFRFRYAPSANFAGQNQNGFKLLGGFGTNTLYIDALDSRTEKGLRYKSCPIGEIYIRRNHQGICNTVLRYFSMTAQQAIQEFGEATPVQIVKKAESNKDALYWFIHYVCPQYDMDPSRADYKGMEYRSVKCNVETQALLSVKGYHVFPFPTSTYTEAPGEDYGRSPGMQALPAMKTLNAQKSSHLKQGHRAADPAYLSHDDGIIDNLRIRPGIINRGGVSADGRLLVQALPAGNYEIQKDMMDEERTAIKQAFLTHLFELAMNSENVPDRMNVPQVLERMKEKGILLAPVVGAQTTYYGQVIDREIDVLTQQRLLPPMPPELVEAEGEYDVIYDNPLSRSMRAEESAGFVQSVQFATEIANATGDPSILDPYNFEEALPQMAEINGVPASWMRSQDEIEAIKAKRAAALKAQQDAEAAGPAAALVGAAAKAKVAGLDVGGQGGPLNNGGQ